MDPAKREQSTKDVAIESPQFGPSSEELVTSGTGTENSPQKDAPKTWNIVLLTTGLCMGMFCVALVCPSRPQDSQHFAASIAKTPHRTTQSSQQPSQKSRKTSEQLVMSDGMAVCTFSAYAP
jgi:succinate dehydrogenase/fumarate reductase-like Fe-S protein